MQTVVAVDSQKLNHIQLCARKFDFTFLQDLEPVSKAEALERGDLLHKMLQTYYTLCKSRSRWAQNGHSHEDILNICKKVGDHHAVGMELDLEECDIVKNTFTDYCRFFADERLDIIAVEQVGSRVLHEDEELKIIYETRIDLVVRVSGMLIPWDHKSSQKRQEVISISNQFIGYCWMLGSHNIIINKVGFQKTLPAREKFIRTTLSYPTDVIEEWRESVVWWVKLAVFYMKSNFFPPNYTSCDKWGGCIFRHICETERKMRGFKILRDFNVRKEPWDVGRKLR